MHPTTRRAWLAVALLLGSPDPARADALTPCNPNDTTVLERSAIVACAVNPVGDTNLFTFPAAAGERLLLTVMDTSNDIFGAQPSVQVYDDAFQLLATIGADNTGTSLQIDVAAAGAGTYTVLVVELNGDQTVTYHLALQTLDPAPDETQALVVNDVIASSIAPRADSDVFSFEGTTGERIFLTLSDTSNDIFGATPAVQIFDPNGDPLGAPFGADNTGAERELDLPATGTYTVLLREAGDDQEASYNIALQRLAPASPEAEPLVINQVLQRGITPVADSDVFLFEGTAGDRMILTLSDRSNDIFGATPTAQVLDPNGDPLGAPFGADNTGAIRELELAATGTHTVLVREVGNDQQASFHLALQRLLPISPEALSLCSGCVAERTLGPVADSAVFAFHGSAGQVVIVTATDRSNDIFGATPSAQIYDPSGQPMGAPLGLDNTGQNRVVTLAETGTHIVLVTEAGNDQGLPYSLALQCLGGICDTDGDGFRDEGFAASCIGGPGAACNDNCPSVFNSGQSDTGTIGTPANPLGLGGDGVGDGCQCGDVNRDARVLGNDATLIRRHLLGLPVPASFDISQCNVTGTGGNEEQRCNGTDATVIRRNLLGLPPPALLDNCVGPRPWSEGRN